MTLTLVPFSLHILWLALAALAAVGLLSSTVFLVMTIVAEVRHVRWARSEQARVDAMPASTFPPVTILKPVHGAEEQLFANLESFFQQDYPNYEVIFGVRDAENPAARVAEEVRQRHPNVASRIMFSGPPEWPNAKVFSLDKMITASANQYFIISDSDVRVAPNFLRNAIAPLLDHKVGLITCMYRGIPASARRCPGLAAWHRGTARSPEDSTTRTARARGNRNRNRQRRTAPAP